uniref:HD-GYP domain-containing protein n=1 Tax=candidate division WOR-3 bacterium TaxID=2052148 RepID=A0A7C4U7Y9_UNCW3
MNENILDFRNLLKINERINSIKDIDSLLELILYEARKFTNADAGTIYLIKDGKLSFEYVQNDTLFRKFASSRFLYKSQTIEINDKSIAGYVALTGNTLNIQDAYDIPENCSFSFNKKFDEETSYRTKSILTLPLKTHEEQLIGVLQLINKKMDGESVPFTDEDVLLVSYFAISAANAIERALITREMIMRMINMAELRDPKETGSHVNRVGSYSVEIYREWAIRKKLPTKEIKKAEDNLRIAAMLHDIGKVAISDAILKKPGRLNEEEYNMMKYHTIFGARLFKNRTSELDRLGFEVALNHHERWDGKGYPGFIDDVFSEKIELKEGKKGEEIPLFGRIVAVADVYDALISKRAYKEAWSDADALKEMEYQKEKQFDPEIVDIFISIYDVIKAIRDKFKE